MPWRIIVASNEADQLAEFKKGAAQIEANIRSWDRGSLINEATSVEEIRQFRGDPHDIRTELIIITAALAESGSGLNAQNLSGLQFVKGLQANPPACIIVSERQEHWAEVQGMSRCRLLLVGAGTSYIDDCVRLASELGVGTPPKMEARARGPDLGIAVTEDFSRIRTTGEPYALIEIDLPSNVRGATVKSIVTYPMREQAYYTTPLGLKQRDVDDLVKDSRKLSEKFSKALEDVDGFVEWQTEYQSLGERFFKLLNTREFAEQFNYAKGVAGHDVRLRFNLSRSVFDGLWESMFNPKTNSYLMLDSAITRKDRDSIDRFPGGQGGSIGILNILVVGATVGDNSAPDGPGDALWKKFWAGSRLKKLPHVDKEVAALKALEGSSAALKIKVDVLSGNDGQWGPGRWSLADTVKDHLAKNPRRYDVIHFAGHALFASQKQRSGTTDMRRRVPSRPRNVTADDRGYVVFSGFPNPQAIPIAIVASWLRDTSVELVYLSCCRSSAARAAAEFARNNIRTTIGFSWDLDDSKAVDFAQLFYEALLKNQLKVCSAIRDARDNLYNKYSAGDPIWASPVLLAQPQDWLHVEAVLWPPVR